MAEVKEGNPFHVLLSPVRPILDASEIARTVKLLEYSFTVGFMLGGFTAGRQALLQFQAEHQHLLPTLKRRSHWVMWVRQRNYRVMAAFGAGGIKRGGQMTGVALAYTMTRFGLGRVRRNFTEDGRLAWIDDVAGGIVAGGLFAYAGKGHRLYYMRRGTVLGGIMGACLAAVRLIHEL